MKTNEPTATPSPAPDKGTLNGPCNRTACQKPGADHWNYSTRAYYCAACAQAINDRAGFELCVREDHRATRTRGQEARERYGDVEPSDLGLAPASSPAPDAKGLLTPEELEAIRKRRAALLAHAEALQNRLRDADTLSNKNLDELMILRGELEAARALLGEARRLMRPRRGDMCSTECLGTCEDCRLVARVDVALSSPAVSPQQAADGPGSDRCTCGMGAAKDKHHESGCPRWEAYAEWLDKEYRAAMKAMGMEVLPPSPTVPPQAAPQPAGAQVCGCGAAMTETGGSTDGEKFYECVACREQRTVDSPPAAPPSPPPGTESEARRVKDPQCKRWPAVCGEVADRHDSNSLVCQLPDLHEGPHNWSLASPTPPAATPAAAGEHRDRVCPECGHDGSHYSRCSRIRRPSPPDANKPAASAAPATERAATDLNAIGEMLGIGSATRDLSTIRANIGNLQRRTACLSAIEREFFTREVPVDEADDETLGRECVLGWGAEPASYVEQFRRALAALASPPAPGPEKGEVTR